MATDSDTSRRIVVLGDMVRSRDRVERGRLADRLTDTLDRLNGQFADQVQAPLTMARGIDEISGVFRRPEAVFDMLVRLNLYVWPAFFRFSVVRGEVDVHRDSRDASKMDGPAFHKSAAAIESLKASGLLLHLDTGLCDPASEKLYSLLGTAHLKLLAQLKQGSIRVLKAYYQALPGQDTPTQDEVAARIGFKSRQAVSDALQRADYDFLVKIEDAMRDWARGLPC